MMLSVIFVSMAMLLLATFLLTQLRLSMLLFITMLLLVASFSSVPLLLSVDQRDSFIFG